MKRRLRYLVERVVTRPGMLMLLFAVACVIFIAVVAAFTYFLTPADARDVAQIVWQSMRHVIDPGRPRRMTSTAGRTGWSCCRPPSGASSSSVPW